MYFSAANQKYVIETPAIFHEFFADASKHTIILLTFHIMFYSKDGKSGSARIFLEQWIYLVIGLAAYWLIFDRLFKYNRKDI